MPKEHFPSNLLLSPCFWPSCEDRSQSLDFLPPFSTSDGWVGHPCTAATNRFIQVFFFLLLDSSELGSNSEISQHQIPCGNIRQSSCFGLNFLLVSSSCILGTWIIILFTFWALGTRFVDWELAYHSSRRCPTGSTTVVFKGFWSSTSANFIKPTTSQKSSTPYMSPTCCTFCWATTWTPKSCDFNNLAKLNFSRLKSFNRDGPWSYRSNTNLRVHNSNTLTKYYNT